MESSLVHGGLTLNRFGVAVPGGQCPCQISGALHFDRSGTQGVAPLELSKIPSGECQGIVDHDNQILLPAGVFLADLGVAAFDQQPATAAGSRKRGVFEADQRATLRETVAV
jgi:hypothetical protein